MENNALTTAEMDVLRNAGYLPCGGGVYDGEIKVKMALEGNVFLMTRAQWRTVVDEMNAADERLRLVTAECATIREARAVEALRVTGGYTTEELRAMPDSVLSHLYYRLGVQAKELEETRAESARLQEEARAAQSSRDQALAAAEAANRAAELARADSAAWLEIVDTALRQFEYDMHPEEILYGLSRSRANAPGAALLTEFDAARAALRAVAQAMHAYRFCVVCGALLVTMDGAPHEPHTADCPLDAAARGLGEP